MPNWVPDNDPEWQDPDGRERGAGAIVWLFAGLALAVLIGIAIGTILEALL